MYQRQLLFLRMAADVVPNMTYTPDFIPEEIRDGVMKLLSELPYKSTEHLMGNMLVNSSVKYVWVTDTGLPYVFGKTLLHPLEPHSFEEFPVVKCMRDYVEKITGRKFNSVLVNFYASGEKGLSPHSDDDPWLGDDFIVPSLSLGAARIFRVTQKKEYGTKTIDVVLESGSLVIMGEGMQKKWLHSIPKTTSKKNPVGPRYNLTFRHVYPELFHKNPKIIRKLPEKFIDKRK